MKKEAAQNKNSTNESSKYTTDRRSLLKALAGVPVLGLFGFGALEKLRNVKPKRNNALVNELDFGGFKLPTIYNKSSKGELIRLGIIGFGMRGNQLANALGFMHPTDVETGKRNGTLNNWLLQENLNVAVTAICDVFEPHAQKAIETFSNDVRPGDGDKIKLPVKRYRTYQELIASKDVDAVIIAAPDHHHNRMAIEVAKAGKPIYCEKSPGIHEEELYAMYDAVKESGVVFQLGHQITKNVVFQKAKELIKKDVLGKITLVEATTNRNTAHGAWIRHLDNNGNPKPGSIDLIDWDQWLGTAPKVPFSIDRFYNWTKWFDYDLGMFGQLFTHEYDAINQLLNIGIPYSAVASGGLYFWKDNRDMPDLLNAVFEYPDKELSLVYSASLASSLNRGRVFMGTDASMELGGLVKITADNDSKRYAKYIKEGMIDNTRPMFTIDQESQDVDVVTSATQQYYKERGLWSTYLNGVEIDVTHLHLKEWLECIRNGGETSGNIERTFEEGITVLMGHKAYLTGRKVKWDPVNRKIV